MSILGALIAVVGVIAVPLRAWPNLLLAAYYLLGIGLAGAIFLAIQYVSNAGWSVAIRRVPEAMIASLPVASIAMLVLLFGIHDLYEWSHLDILAVDKILQAKRWWLNIPWFAGRMVFFLGMWLFFAFALVRLSRRQDEHDGLEYFNRAKRYSALFLVVVALSLTLASMDWIMSIEPHWYSTIFGIYNFAGLFQSGLAAIAILAIVLRRAGPLEGILTSEHLHDLGKLIVAFSTFWMYIWFSQYLLIWYSNIPEEASYLVHRQEGSWAIFTVLNVVFNWVIPFVVLLPKWTKRNEGVLLKVGIILLIGHWIDLFWMILPPFMRNGPQVGLWEIGPVAGAVAAAAYLTLRSFAKANPIPKNDPLIVESLNYHS
ncbi:MAG: hypothetical protein FJ215_09270 [Ignavibacteria bacterium]|nr:hypothetical protein [Ignavibacteria bacterium]